MPARKKLNDARRNQRSWDKESSEYQREHGPGISGRAALAWGLWRIPERDLKILGAVRGKQILELGCGAAQFSRALRRRGASPIGMDNSIEQLRHGRRAASKLPLVQADAEYLPFWDESFDVVFCDYGAMSFADPEVVVPEVARVLRADGLFAFSTTTPLLAMCWPADADEATTSLHRPYFGMKRTVWEGDDTVDYQLPYGEWIRVFRTNGFVIEDLIEVQPPSGSKTSFPGRPLKWSRKWPAEMIWKVRKEASS